MQIEHCNKLVPLLAAFVLCSCGSGMKISRSSLKPIPAGYNATLSNPAIRKQGKDFLARVSPDSITLVQLLDTIKSGTDSIRLSRSEDGRLIISYPVNGTLRTSILNGRYRRWGYYEIVFLKKVTNIPPFIGFLFSRRRINRVRLALTKENELLIDRHYVIGGNILLFGGGDDIRSQYWFRHLH